MSAIPHGKVRDGQSSRRNIPGLFRKSSLRTNSSTNNVDDPDAVEISIVIPVYNGGQTIGSVVSEIQSVLAGRSFEIILVNDGSRDDSEAVCGALVELHPEQICLVQLTRNFGEHNAVLAGLKLTSGQCVAVLDDDGQNRPDDILRMIAALREQDLDVVYGRYRDRKHPPLRILGSWFNDSVACLLLKKPCDLYLSSFKVMNRLLVNEICKYAGPFPYIDGLILRVTQNCGQIDVQHAHRQHGKSGYTLCKLIALWMNMSAGFSIIPLRIAALVGAAAMIAGIFMLTISLTIGVVLLAGGVQLMAIGALGEYVGRLLLHQSGMPQSVQRYVHKAQASLDGATLSFAAKKFRARMG